MLCVINVKKLKKFLKMQFFSLVFLLLQKKVVPLQIEKSAFLYRHLLFIELLRALFLRVACLWKIVLSESFGCDFEDVEVSLRLKRMMGSKFLGSCLF